jgi:hypothetical protein
VLHALEAEDVVGEVAQLRVGAPQGLHLEAQPVVEVDVEGRQHARVVVVSGLHQAIRQLPLSVVVDEGERGDDLALPAHLVLDQPATHQVAHRLRAVAELPPLQEGVETPKQLLLYREADALQLHRALHSCGPEMFGPKAARRKAPRPLEP